MTHDHSDIIYESILTRMDQPESEMRRVADKITTPLTLISVGCGTEFALVAIVNVVRQSDSGKGRKENTKAPYAPFIRAKSHGPWERDKKRD